MNDKIITKIYKTCWGGNKTVAKQNLGIVILVNNEKADWEIAAFVETTQAETKKVSCEKEKKI